MSNADQLTFDLANELESESSIFVKKDWLNILDSQNGSYTANQSIIQSASIASSNRYINYKEAYIAMPLLLTCSTTGAFTNNQFLPNNTLTSADTCMSLKNGFHSMIHSITIDYNSSTLVQQQPFINMWNSFKLQTTMSFNDMLTLGPTIGFYLDSSDSFSFESSTNSACGSGTCNNQNLIDSDVVAGSFYTPKKTGNQGMMNRQRYMTYNGDSVISTSGDAVLNSALLTSQACANIWQSHISTKINQAANQHGIIQHSVMAIIYLKHLSDIFTKLPLLKNAFLKLTLTLNNASTNLVTRASVTEGLTLRNVVVNSNGINPLLIASSLPGNGANSLSSKTAGVITNYILDVSVGAVTTNPTLVSQNVPQGALSRNIYMYLPSYIFNPVFETVYLSNSLKLIQYNDVYQFQIMNVASNSSINSIVTNGIANLKSMLIVAFYSVGAANGLTIPCYQSCYDCSGSGPQSPKIQLSSFNVQVSGQNMIYNTQNRSYEQFLHNNYGVNSVNSGQTLGLSSGLISKYDFENTYGSYYIDLSRQLPVEKDVLKSVSVMGTNVSAKSIDLFVFLEYGLEVTIDVLSGVLIK